MINYESADVLSTNQEEVAHVGATYAGAEDWVLKFLDPYLFVILPVFLFQPTAASLMYCRKQYIAPWDPIIIGLVESCGR
jgi:hypothetical protein